MRRITLKKLLTLFVLPVAVLAFNSCIFNAEESGDEKKTPPPAAFKSLKARDDILFNLRLAYNQRNANEYDKLLDAGFIFFFSAQDVIDGNVQSSQWGRTSELTSAGHMFDPTFDPGPRPDGKDPEPIGSISLTMNFPAGEDSWNPQIDELVHPGEIWYEKTVDYHLVVVAGETTYTSPQDINASLVIRFTEIAGDSIYRLVAWRDDI